MVDVWGGTGGVQRHLSQEINKEIERVCREKQNSGWPSLWERTYAGMGLAGMLQQQAPNYSAPNPYYSPEQAQSFLTAVRELQPGYGPKISGSVPQTLQQLTAAENGVRFTRDQMQQACFAERKFAQEEHRLARDAFLRVLEDEADASDQRASGPAPKPGSGAKTVHRAMNRSTTIAGTLGHRNYWLPEADKRPEPEAPPASREDGYRDACRDHACRLRELMAKIRKL